MRCAGSPPTCSRPCTRRPASASRHRRSACCSGWSWSTSPTARSGGRWSLVNPEIVWRSERAGHRRGGLPQPARAVRRRDPPAGGPAPLPTEQGAEQELDGRRPAGPLPAARDRPSRRHPVRRPPVGPAPQHDPAQARQGAARACLTPGLRLVVMGTTGFVLPSLDALHRRRPRRRRGLHPAAPSRRSRPPAAPHARARGGRAAGPAGAHAAHLEGSGRPGRVRGPRRRPRRRRRLRPAAAAAGPRRPAAGLHQPARLAAAALARRRTDRAGDPGRRPGDRHQHLPDGGGAGHRPGARDAAAADRARRPRPPSCTSGWPALAAEMLPEVVAGTRRRHPALPSPSRAKASPTRTSSTRGEGRLDFTAPGASCRAPPARAQSRRPAAGARRAASA